MIGEPTRYELLAAAHTARLIDTAGNDCEDARSGYRTMATDGLYPPLALRVGESLLLEAGLLRVEARRLIPSLLLHSLAMIDNDDDALVLLSRLIRSSRNEVDRLDAGMAGEEHVLAEVKRELETLGHHDLGQHCERVSLVSDHFGYDIAAPTLDGLTRRLEVKTQTSTTAPMVARFFITRNEYDVGRDNPTEWALVVCIFDQPSGDVMTVGWCRAVTLTPYLPVDHSGHWTEAIVKLPASALADGIPPAI